MTSSSSNAHDRSEASCCAARMIVFRVLGTSSWCLVSKWAANCDCTMPCLWLLQMAMRWAGKYSKMLLNCSIANVCRRYPRGSAARDYYILPTSRNATSERRCLGLLYVACSRHAALQCCGARPGYRSCSGVWVRRGNSDVKVRNPRFVVCTAQFSQP